VIREVACNNLYKYVKSNNNNAKFIHIVRGLVSVNGNSVNAKLMCGNNMGTQKGLTFCVSNNPSPCEKCIEIELQKDGGSVK